jgi:hypothetical protein
MELKTANHTAATVIILASKQLKNTFSKQGAYLKTNLKVENFYPSVNVIARLMELILN